MQENTAVTQRQPNSAPQQVKEIEFMPFGAADRIKLNVKIVQTLCAVATRSGQLPTEQDAMRFMMLCRAQRLNPFAGDAFLIGYDTKNGPRFNLITAHQAFLKRAETHPQFDGMGSGVIVSPGWDCPACNNSGLLSDNGKPTICPLCAGRGKRDEVEGDFVPEDQTLVGAWAHVKLKERSIPTHRRISLAASRPEFGGPIWEKNPAMMLVKTAEADALRSTFPTLLGGLYAQGEQPLDLIGDNAERSRDVQNIALAQPAQRAALSAPTPMAQRRAAQAAAAREAAPVSNVPRGTPTLVEEPLGPDEATEAAAGLAPEQPQQAPQAPAAPAEKTPQEQLADVVSGIDCSFEDFIRVGRELKGEGDLNTGILAWDTYGDFNDVPAKAAKFFLRVRTAVIDGLKGGAK